MWEKDFGLRTPRHRTVRGQRKLREPVRKERKRKQRQAEWGGWELFMRHKVTTKSDSEDRKVMPSTSLLTLGRKTETRRK